MSECKPCDDKRAKLAAEEISQPVTNALWITCTCGLARILPSGTYNIGDPVELIPCPRCGSPFIGTFVGDHIDTKF